MNCKFPGDCCNGERILKIGLYLTKLCVEHLGVHFFWPTLYIVRSIVVISVYERLLFFENSIVGSVSVLVNVEQSETAV